MSKYSLHQTPSDISQSLIEKIKVLRKQEGLSQVELATRSGVSLGSIKRFERTGEISLSSLLQIVYVLDRLEDFKLILNPNNEQSKEHLFSI